MLHVQGKNGTKQTHAPVAQWIEQPPPKGQVGRSIRLRGASEISCHVQLLRYPREAAHRCKIRAGLGCPFPGSDQRLFDALCEQCHAGGCDVIHTRAYC